MAKSASPGFYASMLFIWISRKGVLGEDDEGVDDFKLFSVSYARGEEVF
jgi:hypothetical protein